MHCDQWPATTIKLNVNKLFFWPFILFDAEIKRNKAAHPIVTTTERRQRQNTGIAESKALFVVYKDDW